MPRYYFHFFDGQAFLDEEGSELATLSDMKTAAIETLSDLIRDRQEALKSCKEWRLQVKDEAGREVFELCLVSDDGSSDSVH